MISISGRMLGAAARLSVAAAIVGATAVGVMALYDRAGASISAEPMAPLPVLAAPVRREPGYVETRRFAGRLEPARSVALGFERSGKVVEVLVREGDAVAEGDVLARLDRAILVNECEQIDAARKAQAAVVDLARVTDARQSAMLDSAVSAQRRDEARLTLAQAEAELAATEAALAGVEIDLAKSELRAPFDGRVAARLADEGAILEPGDPALDLLETSAPRARIGVAPEVADGLEVGASQPLRHRGRTYSATLAALRPDLDPASRTVLAIFDLSPDASLAFGDLIELEVEAWRAQPGYWLPLAALSEGERGLWSVYVVLDGEGGRRVAREAVRVVVVEGERAFVSGAITDGAEVIRDGAHRVIPGQAVRVAAAAE